MPERRKFRRKDLLFYARVYDSKSGRTIGNLLNITPDGAMVLSEKQVDSDLMMELHIELPDGIATKQELVFTAKSLWCQPDINPEFYDVGFQFDKVSDEDGKIIQRMIEEYGFRE
jgi:PilZ domain